MISAEDIDAFKERFGESLSQAETFARRKEKGLPVDRWASTREMYLVANGIRALHQIIAMQTAVIVAMTEAEDADADADN